MRRPQKKTKYIAFMFIFSLVETYYGIIGQDEMIPALWEFIQVLKLPVKDMVKKKKWL